MMRKKLSEVRRKFGDHVNLKSFCCHGQVAPFPVAPYHLTSFGRLSYLTLGDARLLRFGYHWKLGGLPVATPFFTV